eukprot:2902058-Prymnesium_polylepis.1
MPRRVGEGAQDRQRDEVADAPRATEAQPDVVQGLSAPMTRRNPHVTEPPWDLLNVHSSHFCCARARCDRCLVCRRRDTVHPSVLCVAPTLCFIAVVCRPFFELRGCLSLSAGADAQQDGAAADVRPPTEAARSR